MAQPSSRQGLIDYALRKLEVPVLEINIDDDQIDDSLMMRFKFSTRGILMVLKRCI